MRGAIEERAPPHDVVATVHASWQELYDKRPVDLPTFKAGLGRQVPQVPEKSCAQVQGYSIGDLQFTLDKADGKAPGSAHIEARFIKALQSPIQWLLVHSHPAILRDARHRPTGGMRTFGLAPSSGSAKLEKS